MASHLISYQTFSIRPQTWLSNLSFPFFKKWYHLVIISCTHLCINVLIPCSQSFKSDLETLFFKNISWLCIANGINSMPLSMFYQAFMSWKVDSVGMNYSVLFVNRTVTTHDQLVISINWSQFIKMLPCNILISYSIKQLQNRVTKWSYKTALPRFWKDCFFGKNIAILEKVEMKITAFSTDGRPLLHSLMVIWKYLP